MPQQKLVNKQQRVQGVSCLLQVKEKSASGMEVKFTKNKFHLSH